MVEEDDEKLPPGYFWALVSGMQAFVLMLFATVGASVLCFTYILGSMILWVLGICRISVWLKDNWGVRDKNIPESMPGQENTDHWERAWELACLRNNGVRDKGTQAHFHIVPLLKSKAGLDMQHLAQLSKTRDPKSKSEQELAEVDRNLPDARIDLEHLLRLVRLRADQRRKDFYNNVIPAAQPPDPSTAGSDLGGGRREDGRGSAGGGVGGTSGGGAGAGRADSDVGDTGGNAGSATTPANDPAASGGSAAADTHGRGRGEDDPSLLTPPAPAYGVGMMSPPIAPQE